MLEHFSPVPSFSVFVPPGPLSVCFQRGRAFFFGGSIMLPSYPSCDFACFVSEMSSSVAGLVGGGFHLAGVVLGGLVLWVGFILAR